MRPREEVIWYIAPWQLHGSWRRPEKHRLKFDVLGINPSNHRLLAFYYPTKMTKNYKLLLMW